jgi:hypothetical protein
MIFRYKIWSHQDSFSKYVEYNIIIQKHTSSIFHWETVAEVELRSALNRIGELPFQEFNYFSDVPIALVYDELKKYKSMDEIIMKYITKIILKRIQKQNDEERYNDMISKFVLTKGWKTIEIKENET